jgi:hypothetical protein
MAGLDEAEREHLIGALARLKHRLLEAEGRAVEADATAEPKKKTHVAG